MIDLRSLQLTSTPSEPTPHLNHFRIFYTTLICGFKKEKTLVIGPNLS